MANVQLIIDGQIADTYPGQDIVPSISYSISDINDIEKRTSPTTKTIKIPATGRNRRIFGYPDDPTVTGFKGQKVSVIGVVRESGTDVLTGIVNLKTHQRTNKESYYEITIIGNSAEWIETMSANSLRSLGNAGQHYKTQAVIEASYAGDLEYAYGLINEGYKGHQLTVSSIEDDGNGKCLCMIDGTNRRFRIADVISLPLDNYMNGFRFDNPAYNTWHQIDSIVTVDGINIAVKLKTRYAGNSSGVLRLGANKIQVEDMTMLINVEKLFTRMFNAAGYRVQSDFIASDYFKSLFMLPGSEFRTEAECEAQRVKVGLTADVSDSGVISYRIPLNNIIEGNWSNWDTTLNKYQGGAGWKVRFKAKIRIKGTEGYRANVRFATSPVTNNYAGEVTTTIMELTTLYQELNQEGVYRMESGDCVEVYINMPTMGGVAGDLAIEAEGTEVECILEPDIIQGSLITPYQFLPDQKQINFLKGIRHLFNLYFLTDVNKKVVYVEPRDTFYLRDKIVDWTGKMDISLQVTLEELGSDMAKVLVFRYKEDGDDWGISEYNRKTGDVYSSHKVTLNNRFSGNDEKAIENPFFAATIMGTYDSAGLTKTLLPKIWQQPEEGDIYPDAKKEYLPRILSYAGMRDCKAGEGWKFIGSNKTELPYFFSYDQDSANDKSLLFKPQAGLPDLYSKYYENYIRTLNDGRKITCYMKLTPQDIQQIVTIDPSETLIKDFRSMFYLKNGGGAFPCRLESINDYASGANKPTKVVLVTESDNIFDQTTVFVNEMTFTNDTIAQWNNYANVAMECWANSWAACRGALSAGFTGQSLNYGAGAQISAGKYRIQRAFLFFDTSNIPDTATITEVYLDIYKISGDANQEIAVCAGLQNNITTSNNFQSFGSSFGESTPGNLGLRRIYLNDSGRTWISKTGWTKFCLRNVAFDLMNVAPPSYYSPFIIYLVNSPEQYRNKLVVKYI